jgi:hypothetical protein
MLISSVVQTSPIRRVILKRGKSSSELSIPQTRSAPDRGPGSAQHKWRTPKEQPAVAQFGGGGIGFGTLSRVSPRDA